MPAFRRRPTLAAATSKPAGCWAPRSSWNAARPATAPLAGARLGLRRGAGAHARLNAAGIPAVLLADPVLGPGNSYWHTVNDLPGQASRETLGLVGAVVTEVVYRGIPEEGR